MADEGTTQAEPLVGVDRVMRWLGLLSIGCASCAEIRSTEPPIVSVPVQPAPPAIEAPPAPVVVAAPVVEREELPPLWTLDAPNVPRLGFVEARTRARVAREQWKKLASPAVDDASRKAWFVRVTSIADEASRYYASAFHAGDVTEKEHVEALTEAAELDASIARRLDELGLEKMPLAWRTEPAIRSSFEDVAEGPARRWRNEARALAKHCVEVARQNHLAADAVERCTALRTSTGAKLLKGNASPCGCAPGDPLCSASLGGVCKD